MFHIDPSPFENWMMHLLYGSRLSYNKLFLHTRQHTPDLLTLCRSAFWMLANTTICWFFATHPISLYYVIIIIIIFSRMVVDLAGMWNTVCLYIMHIVVHVVWCGLVWYTASIFVILHIHIYDNNGFAFTFHEAFILHSFQTTSPSSSLNSIAFVYFYTAHAHIKLNGFPCEYIYHCTILSFYCFLCSRCRAALDSSDCLSLSSVYSSFLFEFFASAYLCWRKYTVSIMAWQPCLSFWQNVI